MHSAEIQKTAKADLAMSDLTFSEKFRLARDPVRVIALADFSCADLFHRTGEECAPQWR